MPCPTLGVVGGVEQPVDQLFVGVVAGVGDEPVDLPRGWHHADEIETQTPDQRAAIRGWRRLDALALETSADEAVDRMRIVALGRRHVAKRRVGPVRLPRGSLFDPAPDHVDLVRGQSFCVIGRRHAQPRVLGADAVVERARFDGSGHRHRAQRVGVIEVEIGFAIGLVGTVTLCAVLGEDRANVAAVVDVGDYRCLRGGKRRRRGHEREECDVYESPLRLVSRHGGIECSSPDRLG